MPATLSSTPILSRLERHELISLERSLSLEWLETDGLGGYASSTVLFCPTRRYHGLLVGRPATSHRRHVFLSRFEETIEDGETSLPFSMARYAGLFSPEGHTTIESFEERPFPSTEHRVGDALVRREVLMVRGQGTVLCRYHITTERRDLVLTLRPLLPFREADALTTENDALDPRTEPIPDGIRCRPYAALPPLHLTVGGAHAQFRADPVWYRGLEFSADAERGYPGHEDEFSPGVLGILVDGETEVVVAATLGSPVEDPPALWRAESTRREREARAAMTRYPPATARVALGANDFLYRDASGRLGVDAGYPWFEEWGRDTFISLPGLTLGRGDVEACGDALSGARAFLKNGLLPNVYGKDREDSHYGSVDAALWFARAVRLYQRAGGPPERILDEFRPALSEIAEAYRDGTDLGVRCDEDGMIVAGGPGLNATWMDAQTEDGPVTPRDGCAVEINALWYSLLQHVEKLAVTAGHKGEESKWNMVRRRARRSFLARFWLADERYLADGWKDGIADRRVRPNMVIAAAMEFSPLTRVHRRNIVERAASELLTPRGLRTLAPSDPDYVGRYGGGPRERDEAYHQGTVWPWLLGFYIEACLRAHGTKKAYRKELAGLWDGFAVELDRAGLGHISEVFDGDTSHQPGGTIAQAWNTAEWLRSRAMLAQSRNP